MFIFYFTNTRGGAGARGGARGARGAGGGGARGGLTDTFHLWQAPPVEPAVTDRHLLGTVVCRKHVVLVTRVRGGVVHAQTRDVDGAVGDVRGRTTR